MTIVLEQLRKSYGEYAGTAWRRSDDSEPGGITGLLGPNGAGKTTLVEILEGLRERSERARLSVLGLDPAQHAAALKQRIGVQLQSTAMPLDLSAHELLEMYAAFYPRALPVADVLRRVGLVEKRARASAACRAASSRGSHSASR